MRRIWLTASLTVLPLFNAAFAQEGKPATEAVSFTKEIAPILVQRCVACHGSTKPKGNFNLSTFDAFAKGLSGDPVFVPGKPDESVLVECLLPDASPRMPYKEEPLAKEQIDLIARWIEQGARFDGPSTSAQLMSIIPKPKNLNVSPPIYPAPIAITALAFSPDGTHLATGGYHEVLIWELASGKLVRRLQNLPERTYAIRFSSNGWWIATASGTPAQSGVVRLWDARTGEVIRDLIETEDSVFALAFSGNSRLLAAGGCDRTIRIWDLASGKLAKSIEDHADWVLDLDFSPDGTRLVSGSRDKTCKVFDVAKGESLVTFPEHQDAVYAVAFARDGKSVATAGGDKVIKVWDPANDAKKIRDIGGHAMAVFKLQYNNDGSQLLTCSADKTAREFNPSNGQQTRALQGHNDWIYVAAFSQDAKSIATGSWDGEVRLWNAADGAQLKTFVAIPTKDNNAGLGAIDAPSATPAGTATAQQAVTQ
jgi:WD40 repeat protein/mono/diheme cytochrome c family protein